MTSFINTYVEGQGVITLFLPLLETNLYITSICNGDEMIIYKAINKINGKFYIGQTKHKLNKRKNQHKHKSKNPIYNFHKALNKYGFDNFNWEIIDTALTKEELSKKEIYHITITSAYICDELGYNQTSGGDIPILSGRKSWWYTATEEQREQHRQAVKKNHHDVNGKNNPMHGRTHTSEVREKLRLVNTGLKRKPFSEQQKTNMSINCWKNKKVKINDKIFINLTKAGEYLGITGGAVKNRINKKWKGYILL